MDTLFALPETRIAVASAQTGIQPERIRSVRLQMDILRQQGLLIDINIHGAGMFTRSATWEELGISQGGDDARAGRLTKGQKYLYPEEIVHRLRSVETRMRQWLDRHSYDVSGFRPFRWVPYTAYPTWRQRWTELLAEFEQIKDECIQRQPEFLELARQEFTQIAHASWKAITAQSGEQVIHIGTATCDHDAFVQRVVTAALTRFPTPERIQLELEADYTTALVYGEEDVAADELRAQQLRSQANAEREADRARSREQYLQAEILQEQYNHQRRMNQLAQIEKENAIEAMRQAEAEHARQQLLQIASPFEEVFASLRRQLAEDAEEMLVSIRKNGFVRGKVAEKGRGLLEFFDLLAVHQDDELRNRLVALRQALGTAGERRSASESERNTAHVASLLQDIAGLAHSAAQDLSAGPSRFSLIE